MTDFDSTVGHPVRTFGWSDMFVRPEDDPRSDGGYDGAEVEFAERFVAEAADLGVKGRRGDEEYALREILVHMIEEYARHNGHADLLRERIDGRVGQ